MESLVTKSDLRSMAYVTHFIDSNETKISKREDQIKQLDQLAKLRKLRFTEEDMHKGKLQSYDYKHTGATLHEKVQSVISQSDIRNLQYRHLNDQDAVTTFFQVGKSLFTNDYYEKLDNILSKDLAIANSAAVTPGKRSTARNTTTDTSKEQRSPKVPIAGKTQDTKGKSNMSKSTSKSQLQISESTSYSKIEQDHSKDKPQTRGTTLAANDQTQGTKENSNPKKPTSAAPKTKNDDQNPTEDLLDIAIDVIMERLHGWIQAAVPVVMDGEAGKQPAHINLRPAQDLENLYIAAFGQDWKVTVPKLAAEHSLTAWGYLQCLVWAFIVKNIVDKRDVLPGTICGLLTHDGAPRKYLAPILSESRLNFDVIVKRAMLNQFRDGDFCTNHVDPVTNRLANELCMILNGHLLLLNADHLRPNWHGNLMGLLQNIFEVSLKLQARLEADVDDWYLSIVPHRTDFDKNEMSFQEGEIGDAIAFTVIPGIFQQRPKNDPKLLVKAKVKRMVVPSERPSSSRQAGGEAEGDETSAAR